MKHQMGGKLLIIQGKDVEGSCGVVLRQVRPTDLKLSAGGGSALLFLQPGTLLHPMQEREKPELLDCAHIECFA